MQNYFRIFTVFCQRLRSSRFPSKVKIGMPFQCLSKRSGVSYLDKKGQNFTSASSALILSKVGAL